MSTSATERGSGAVEAIVGMGLMMFLLIVMVQFTMWQYVRASVRVAALDAARAGSVVDATVSDCLAAFDRAAVDLLAGPVGQGVGSPQCSRGPEEVTVIVTVHLEPTLVVMPSWDFVVTAVAETERIE